MTGYHICSRLDKTIIMDTVLDFEKNDVSMYEVVDIFTKNGTRPKMNIWEKWIDNMKQLNVQMADT